MPLKTTERTFAPRGLEVAMNELVTEVFGWTGALLVLGAYFLVSTGKVSGDSKGFQFLNIGGAGCLIVYTYNCGAYASFAVNSIWVLIGLRSMYNASKARKAFETVAAVANVETIREQA